MNESALEIPEFLRRQRNQGEPMPDNQETVTDAEREAIAETKQDTLEDILKRIDDLAAQRDKITKALSAHKKMAQQMIGRL